MYRILKHFNKPLTYHVEGIISSLRDLNFYWGGEFLISPKEVVNNLWDISEILERRIRLMNHRCSFVKSWKEIDLFTFVLGIEGFESSNRSRSHPNYFMGGVVLPLPFILHRCLGYCIPPGKVHIVNAPRWDTIFFNSYSSYISHIFEDPASSGMFKFMENSIYLNCPDKVFILDLRPFLRSMTADTLHNLSTFLKNSPDILLGASLILKTLYSLCSDPKEEERNPNLNWKKYILNTEDIL